MWQKSRTHHYTTFGAGVGRRGKRVIVETKGSGIAFFDYDNDGWLDIYLTNWQPS